MAFDFPQNPAPGTVFTSGDGMTVYTWTGEVWMMGGGASADPTSSEFVRRIGDTMTGYLTLSGTPLDPQHAASKQYVDDLIAGLTP